MRDLKARALEVFEAHRVEAVAELDGMRARHAAAGLLQSGATATEAIRIAQTAGENALDQLQAETAKMLEQRGRRWRRAMTVINDALSGFTAAWRGWLDPTIRLAGAIDGAVGAAVSDRLAAAAAALQRRHAAFRDGWTAPVGKPWRERHPFMWGGGLALLGAIIGQAVPAMWKDIFTGWSAGATATVTNTAFSPLPSHSPLSQHR